MSKLLEKAHCGEEPVIPKAGTPFSSLSPLEVQAERVGGGYKDEIAEAFFDRMIAAQGLLERMPVLTSDPRLAALGTETRW